MVAAHFWPDVVVPVLTVVIMFGTGIWAHFSERRSSRVERARQQVHAIFHEARQRMSRASGEDPFTFGRRSDW
mgnify:CR=1 FL=1